MPAMWSSIAFDRGKHLPHVRPRLEDIGVEREAFFALDHGCHIREGVAALRGCGILADAGLHAARRAVRDGAEICCLPTITWRVAIRDVVGYRRWPKKGCLQERLYMVPLNQP